LILHSHYWKRQENNTCKQVKRHCCFQKFLVLSDVELLFQINLLLSALSFD